MRAPPQLTAALVAAVVAQCLAWRATDDVALELETSLLEGETDELGGGEKDDAPPSAEALQMRSFFMVVLADPQFGMIHFGEMNWKEEKEMLDLAVEYVNRLKPGFVVIVGDMQNWYQTNRQGAKPENGELANSEAGKRQVEDVQESLRRLQVQFATVAGNHDVGDAPTSASLAWYQAKWGDQFRAFTWEGVRFVSINSQLYYAEATSETDSETKKATQEQTDWLKKELEAAGENDGIVGIVVLSHIPPFIGSYNEKHGWANWHETLRHEVLSITQTQRLPVNLFVCGHFHGNVEGVYSDYFGSQVEVVTSSAVGSPMQWNGSSGPYSHQLASAIAAQPNGEEAFANYIVRDDGRGSADWHLIPQRIQAREDRSGVRVFEFHPVKGYRHQWFSIGELSRVQVLDDKTLGSDFMFFHDRRES